MVFHPPAGTHSNRRLGGVPELDLTFRRTSIIITQYIYAVPSVISEAVVSERCVEGTITQTFRRQSTTWQLKENEWLMITEW